MERHAEPTAATEPEPAHPPPAGRTPRDRLIGLFVLSCLFMAILVGIDVARGEDTPELWEIALGMGAIAALFGLGLLLARADRTGRIGFGLDVVLVVAGVLGTVYGIVQLARGDGNWLMLAVSVAVGGGAALRLLAARD